MHGTRRCAKHQAERTAILDENHRQFQLAASTLHSRRLPSGDTARTEEVSGDFAALLHTWDAACALRAPIDDLRAQEMGPLLTAQIRTVEQCIWIARQLHGYVADQAFDWCGPTEIVRLRESISRLAEQVKHATREEHRRRGWRT
jgi:hypothetical protein